MTQRWMAQPENQKDFLKILDKCKGNLSLAVKHPTIGINTDESVTNEWREYGDTKFKEKVDKIRAKYKKKYSDTEWEQEFNKSIKRLTDRKLESMIQRSDNGEEIDTKELAIIQATGDGHLATKARINKMRAETKAIESGAVDPTANNKLEITVKPVTVTPEQAEEVKHK